MLNTKKSNTNNRPDPVEIEDSLIAPEPGKIKKEREFDLEGHEIFPIDKIDDPEAPEGAVEEDESEDEQALDEEEINPFKDKWEE